MAKPRKAHVSSNRVIATVKSVKGNCSWGHEAGDTFVVDCHDTAGLCGFLYHDIFPYLVMLQFGGGFPEEWGDPDVVTVGCTDRENLVTLELRRQK
jgi:uncharacterized repeat protein (TIGR04076 family)